MRINLDAPVWRPPVRRTAAAAIVCVGMVLACFAAAGSASAGGDAARRSAETEALRAEVQAIVASGAPGAILLARDGSSTIRLASGYANLKSRAPLRITDRFRVGSVTKTFVAVVVLQLAGESRLALDDSVERWLPGLIPNGRAISIRRLLDMTSGLFDYLNDGDTTIERALLGGDWTHVWKPRQLVRIATSHPPRFRPGSSWSYCNTCYVLLGLIVERATGHTLAHELQRRILVPMRLNGTTFDSSPRISGRHAHGYELLGMPPLADVSILSPSAAWAAGAMVSTAGDLARFYGALLGGDLLAPDLLASMTTARRVSKDFGYGLGLARLTLPCGTAWGHDGGIPGYRAWAVSSRDGARQVVVLANLGEDSLTPKGEAAIVRALALAYCG